MNTRFRLTAEHVETGIHTIATSKSLDTLARKSIKDAEFLYQRGWEAFMLEIEENGTWRSLKRSELARYTYKREHRAELRDLAYPDTYNRNSEQQPVRTFAEDGEL